MDEPSQCAIMHRTDPTHLQSLALQLSEKVQSLVDYNEKLMEMKSGNFSFQRQNFQGMSMAVVVLSCVVWFVWISVRWYLSAKKN